MIKVIGDRLFVKKIKVEKAAVSGIVLPDEEGGKVQPTTGVITHLGDGQHLQTMGLKVGDKVLYGKYTGEPVEELDDTTCLFAIDVIGVYLDN